MVDVTSIKSTREKCVGVSNAWAGPVEVSEEELVQVASGLRISQLLVMEWAPVYAAEAGVLVGMLGGDVVLRHDRDVHST